MQKIKRRNQKRPPLPLLVTGDTMINQSLHTYHPTPTPFAGADIVAPSTVWSPVPRSEPQPLLAPPLSVSHRPCALDHQVFSPFQCMILLCRYSSVSSDGQQLDPEQPVDSLVHFRIHCDVW